MTRAPAGAAAILAALSVAGCESTQHRSARLAREGHGSAAAQTLRLGPANRSVHVTAAALLRSPGLAAAVVRMHNSGRSQAKVPILVEVRDAAGQPMYRNDVKGLDPALQGIALLQAGKDAFWVNDQVASSPPPKSLEVRVGRAQASVHTQPPRIAVTGVKLHREGADAIVSGRLANTSATVQRNLVLYCVGLRGGRIVAAGRAILPRVERKPVSFQVYLVGDPRGARLVFTVPPTVLSQGSA